MKRLFLILLVVLLTSWHTFAQVSRSLEIFREKILPEYTLYFSNADLTERGQLCLTAVDRYGSLSSNEKKGVMAYITSAWRESLILVKYNSKSELWNFNNETESAQMIDEWDLNPPLLNQTSENKFHHWFGYIGGQMSADLQSSSFNAGCNVRLGFFLLMNRWDLAVSYSFLESSGSSGDQATWSSSSNYGLMSRVYFPIKKLGISPNVGGEVTYGQPLHYAIVVGVSWFIGIGSLDICIKIGNEVTCMGGYTFSPKINLFSNNK